jgi:hypothetical protein
MVSNLKPPKFKASALNARLDMSSPATAKAFHAAAKAYTKKATTTKAAAMETLCREKILTRRGQLKKAYALKG